jgi:protein ImuB
MKRRVIYLWFPALPAERASRRGHRPLAIVAETGNKVFLQAVNQAARREQLKPGMLLASARAACPALITRPADEAGDQRFFASILAWCRRYTPLIARDEHPGCDGIFLDITGCAHLFGGEPAMLDGLLSKLRQFGLSVCAGLAGTPGAAWALAHYGKDTIIAPATRLADTLSGLPVAGLRLDGETIDTLNRLGLRTIDMLYGLPRASLAARFGAEAVRRLDQALDVEHEPLDFEVELKKHRATLRFAEPIAQLEDVEAALARLLEHLCRKLATRGLGARRLTLYLVQVDNTVSQVTIGTASPNRSAPALARLFHDRLDSLDAGFGIERMGLEAIVSEPLEAEQNALPHAHTLTTPLATSINQLVDRLANRLGFDAVLAFSPAQSHLPERAFITSAAAYAAPDNTPFALPCVTRPLRLFTRPQWLTDFALTSPTSAQMTLWGGKRQMHMLGGPERIAPEWWHDDPAWHGGARDYWWVQDESVYQRLWVYREAQTQRWFLHGLC